MEAFEVRHGSRGYRAWSRRSSAPPAEGGDVKTMRVNVLVNVKGPCKMF